jgi:hypothetical protein
MICLVMSEICQHSPLCAAVNEAGLAVSAANAEITRTEQLLFNGPEGRDWRPGEEVTARYYRDQLKGKAATTESNYEKNLAAITLVGMCTTCPLR